MGSVILLAALGVGLDGPGASAQTAYTQYPLLGSGPGPVAITPGPNGNVWFTVPGAGGAIGEVTDAGAVTLFSQGLSSQLTANAGTITAGPDGNVWFTEDPGHTGNAFKDTGAVGSITPSGAIQETNAGLLDGLRPTGIVTGPDGNLWITEAGGSGAIVRLSPSGAYQDFTDAALGGAQASQPTAGPDGSVWFVLTGGRYGGTGAIARVTPAGSITVFTAGLTPNGNVAGLTSGPNGQLWFTQSDPANGGVGSITPAGTVAELPPASFKNAQPLGITAAADGNLYVTESGGSGAVVEVTPSGSVAPLVTAPSGHPGAITAKPGGDLWVTQTNQNGLGRLPVMIPSKGTTGGSGSTASTSSTGPTGATTTAAGSPLAPPVLGVKFEARPHGLVFVRTSPHGRLVPLTGPVDLAVGSFIDARSGSLGLTMAMGGERTQAVSVGYGRFVVTQPRSRRGQTQLTLAGGTFVACPARGTAQASVARVTGKPEKSTHVVRQLWSKDNHGQFQTHGHDSVATVRGTEWVTQDRCDGTLTKVLRGTVSVHRRGARHSVTITAGHSYLARP